MNITQQIIDEAGKEISNIIKSNIEIQIYANHNLLKYQWRDGRFKETCDVWENESFDTRTELKQGLEKYLKSSGGLEY